MDRKTGKGRITGGLMSFHSVRTKIFASMFLLVLLSGLAMILFAKTEISGKLHVKLKEKGLVLAKRVAEDCISPVITERYFEMTMMFKDLEASEKDIVYVYVENEDGRVLAHSFSNEFPSELGKAHRLGPGQKHSFRDLLTDRGWVHDIAVPVMEGQLGVLHLGLSDSAIKKDVDEIIALIVLFSAFVLLAGTAASLGFSRTITAPLKKLGEAAEAFGHGKTDSRVSITSNDEIGELAETFNEMIAKRQQAEEKIRRSEQFVRDILDTVDEGFIVIDRKFQILTANKAYCNQVGRSCDEIIGSNCFEISHNSYKPCYEEGEECAVQRVFETGGPHSSLHRHKDATGSILYVETKAFPVKDNSGEVTSVIEVINNVSEKHLLEEERLKTQKLEAIGTLAGGIAHDFNNLLQGIFGYISMAKMTISDKEQSLAMLDQAEQALDMTVNLTTQLLTFSKGGKPAKKRVRLMPIIENSVRFALSGSRADFHINADDDLWAVEGDEGQLGQVIQNIVLNAGQAMPDGGTILISAGNVQEQKTERPQLAEGKYVVISVQDKGAGISEEHIHKIFDPYFTTKEKGSGLGLATAYSIVKNHGGVIDFISEPGQGSTFFVYLPAVEAERELKEIPAVSQHVRKGKVLIMDDDALVRNLSGDLIQALGHRVVFSEHGEEALEKYREAMDSGDPFDIVILDLTIRGGMGGRDTIEQLLIMDPGVRAIVSSGYSDDAVVADYEKYGFRARLNKPYKFKDLREMLNALLRNEG
jgi:PAS domain S-box-containing protein